jgi:VanZ family protein
MGLIRWFEKNSDISWIVVGGIMVIIFYLSSIGNFEVPTKPGSGLFSIIYHFSAFFFLNFFLLLALVKGKRYNFILIALFISIFYGASDEFHQYFVPERVSDFEDVLINNAGIFFSTIFYLLVGGRGRFK